MTSKQYTAVTPPWNDAWEMVVLQQQTNAAHGLTSEEAAFRLQTHGGNSIGDGPAISVLTILISQFLNGFVVLLVIAASLSLFFKEWLDAIFIVAVLVVNAGIGFVMEYQAEKSMAALKRLTTVAARVIRNGRLMEISSDEVVPGDVLFVEGGDIITADARIIDCAYLQTDESALTGESLPVTKRSDLISAEKAPLAERANMLFKGTFVVKGNSRAVVTHTGVHSELGAIALLVQQTRPVASPLEKKIKAFSERLVWVTAGLIWLIFMAGMMNGRNWVTMLQTAIALAVAAIPEGLPIVTTLALSFGMLRMVRYNIIVKRLSAVETLGETGVICTDKTGTLTQNKIEVALVQVAGYVSRIHIDTAAGVIHYTDDERIAATPACKQLHQIAALCSTASYYYDGQMEDQAGDPLETGLLKMVFFSDTRPEAYHRFFPKIQELPFSSESRIMVTLHKDGHFFYTAAKGAVEALLPLCTGMLEENEIKPFTDADKDKWLDTAAQHALSGLRVLAFAYSTSQVQNDNLLNKLTFVGLAGFQDPLRADVVTAVEECHSAGIKVVMITGDHPATAKNIALQLGLVGEQDAILTGSDMSPFEQLTKAEKERWLQTAVFARVTPAQKLDLVSLFQEKKMVVAMTGDGVNDAPALKKADIGIAMGKNGTQVAQEVADMILKDDAFPSIVRAIKQGRLIFDNIRKCIIFLLSCNVSELLIIAVTSVLNIQFQLLPLQILFINLITDVLPALALGVTKAAPGIMQAKPYSSAIPIIDRQRWKAILVYAVIITTVNMGAVLADHEWLHRSHPWNEALYNNVLFYSLVFTQILHVFNMSFERHTPIYKTMVFRNRYVWYAVISCVVITVSIFWIAPVKKVLGITISNWHEWLVIAGASLVSLLLVQLAKRTGWVI